MSFASGMAAIAAVLDLVEPGGTIVAPRHSYTGTVGQLQELEAKGRAKVVFVDITDTAAVAEASADAAMVWFESPTNPALEVADIPAIVQAAHEHGALVAVDNTFATPLLQRPLEHGADLVVHSATKYISGHSDVLMGAAIAASDELTAALVKHRSLFGAIPAPLETFLALRGLRTLSVRLERAQATAQELVRRLADHPALEEVRYPGFGAIISIVVRGGAEPADALVQRTRLWVHATSLGGVESTFERRRRWPLSNRRSPRGSCGSRSGSSTSTTCARPRRRARFAHLTLASSQSMASARATPTPLERREVGRQELLGVELLGLGESRARLAPLQRRPQSAGRAHAVEPVERVGVRRDAGERHDAGHALGQQRGAASACGPPPEAPIAANRSTPNASRPPRLAAADATSRPGCGDDPP